MYKSADDIEMNMIELCGIIHNCETLGHKNVSLLEKKHLDRRTSSIYKMSNTLSSENVSI